jgi:hypothetical protein
MQAGENPANAAGTLIIAISSSIGQFDVDS